MISAIVPARNEEARIAATIAGLRTVPEIDEIVIVDDGSTDRTSEVARAAGVSVEVLPFNQGKGAAVSAGVRTAKGDILLLADADLGESAAQARTLLLPLLHGVADLAIATFPVNPGKGGGIGAVVNLARQGILRATGREMLAPLSGQRAIRRAVIEKIGGCAPGFGMEVAMTIDALRAGYRVVEIPTTMTHRVTGRDLRSILHRLRQYRAVRKALRDRL